MHLFEIGNKFLKGEIDFVMKTLKLNYSETEKLYNLEKEKEEKEKQ